MNVVLDTNVLISGIFFGGQPRAVLDAWAENRFVLFISPSIFDECVRTCDRLSASYRGLEYHSVLATIIGRGQLVPDATTSGAITSDPDDDKIMLCARDHGAVIFSGDRHLLDSSGWEGVRVMRPQDFLACLDSRDAPRPKTVAGEGPRAERVCGTLAVRRLRSVDPGAPVLQSTDVPRPANLDQPPSLPIVLFPLPHHPQQLTILPFLIAEEIGNAVHLPRQVQGESVLSPPPDAQP